METIKQIHTLAAPSSPLYSQAISVNGFLFLSGQIPIDPVSGKLVEGGIVEQAQQVFHNIEEILKAAGLDFSSLIRVEIYLKDIQDLPAVNALYTEKMTHTPKPVRHAMQVGALPFHSLIEITCTAAL